MEHTKRIGKALSRYIISNTERNSHHLVVSPETHLAVKLYAQKKRMTISAATQQLLTEILARKVSS